MVPIGQHPALTMLEELGVVQHAHGADGREEFHVLPASQHGHLHCNGCGTMWEVDAAEAATLVGALRSLHGFEVDLTHLSVAGWCRSCQSP